MPTDDDDAKDREYFLARATQVEISRRLSTACARATLTLLEGIEADQERGRQTMDVNAAVAALVPYLGPALKAALAMRDADETLSLRQTARRLGRSPTQFGRVVRVGQSPVPFTMRGRCARFLRLDVDRFVGEGPPTPEGPTGMLVEAIQRALVAAKSDGPALLQTPAAAELLGLRPSQLWGMCTNGTSPVRPLKIGRKFFFKRSDIEAHLAAARKSDALESTNPEQAARSAPARALKIEH
jgi:predicted DNA-binding transcriptional regulator AlpA